MIYVPYTLVYSFLVITALTGSQVHCRDEKQESPSCALEDMPHNDSAILVNEYTFFMELKSFAGKRIFSLSPDGTSCLVQGISPDTVWLCNSATEQQLQEFKGHTKPVLAATFNHDGTKIITGSEDCTVRLWDAQTGQELLVYTHEAPVCAVAFDPHGKTFIAGLQDTTACLWDSTHNGKPLHRVTGPSDWVTLVEFSPQGTAVFLGSQDGTVYQYDVETWDLTTTVDLQVLMISRAYSQKTRISTNGIHASPSSTESPLQPVSPQGDRNGFIKTVFSPYEKAIFTAAHGESFDIWCTQTENKFLTVEGISFLTSAHYNPSGNTLLTDGNEKIKVWKVTYFTDLPKDIRTVIIKWTVANQLQCTNKVLKEIPFLKGKVIYSISTDGTTCLTHEVPRELAPGSYSPGLKLWNIITEQPIQEFDGYTEWPCQVFKGHTKQILSALLNHTGTRVVTGSEDCTARLWDVQTGKELQVFGGHRAPGQVFIHHTAPVCTVAFTADGNIITGSNDHTACLWDSTSGMPLKIFTDPTNRVNAVACSPTGTTFLVGSQDQKAYLYDAMTWKLITTFNHPCGVRRIAYSSDGKTAVIGFGTDAALWDLETLTQRAILHTAPVCTVAFTADGNIITGSNDHTACLWDSTSGMPLKIFTDPTNRVTSVACSPTGTTFLVGSQDQKAYLYDAMTWKLITTFNHPCDIRRIAYSSDGKTAVIGFGTDAALWDLETLTQRAMLQGDDGL